MLNKIIYGKDETHKIVSIDVKQSSTYVFLADGTYKLIPFKKWVLTPVPVLESSVKLEGGLFFQYYTELGNRWAFKELIDQLKLRNIKYYTSYIDEEAVMQLNGMTMYKGLKLEDIGVLSFDIETSGLERDANSTVYLISNTFKKNNNITKKVFRLDHYDNDVAKMLDAWSEWVCQINPDVLTGHNIINYDLPYMQHCRKGLLKIGRLGTYMAIDSYTRKFRKDQSQSYDYRNISIFGRQIIDTWFLSIKYDAVDKKYESYGLKPIIKQEGLEREGRQHYDASKINEGWNIPEEREKIVAYGSDDADDALALFYLMAPSYFYYCQHIPLTFQWINNTATGKQINSFLVRSYIQDHHSIPAPCDAKHYEGATSDGTPGIFYNVQKVDVKSLYPSIMIVYDIFNKDKDPNAHFSKMVKYFTEERLKNKDKAQETKDPFYKALSESQKIFINSAYGMLGASGLNFNSPSDAALVTTKGREILKTGLDWVVQNKYTLVNLDTDSFSYTKGRPVSRDEFETDISDINALFPSGIVWANDGQYDCMIIVATKNYVLYNAKSKTPFKFKGSGIKDQKKEPALREMMETMLRAIANNEQSTLPFIYQNYVNEILNIKDIKRWAQKYTITKTLLNGTDTRALKIKEAVAHMKVSQGDKVFLYAAVDGMEQDVVKGEPVFYKNGKPKLIPRYILREVNQFDGNVDTEHLFCRLYDTVCILQNVINLNLFLNYGLKKNYKLLIEQRLNEQHESKRESENAGATNVQSSPTIPASSLA